MARVISGGAVTAASTGNAGSLPVTLPGTLLAGDLILVFAVDTTNDTWTTPSGYTLSSTQHVRGTSLSMVCYRKVAVSGDAGATVTVDPAGSQRIAVIAVVVRDEDQTTPLDVTITEDDGTNANVTAPTATTVTDGVLDLTVHASRTSSGATSNTWAAPTGYSQVAAACSGISSNSNASAAVFAKTQTTHGATGAVTAVSQYSNPWIAFNVAVRPAASVTELDAVRIETIGLTDTFLAELIDGNPPFEAETTDSYGTDDSTVTATYVKTISEDAGLADDFLAELFDDVQLLPDAKPFTLRWYESLPGFYRALDADQNYALLRYLSLLGDQVDDVETLLATVDVPLPGEPGYDPGLTSALADPTTAEFGWLPWIGQFLGRRVQGLSEQAARDTLTGQAFLTGNAASIEDAARSVLTGSRYVKVYRRSIVLPGDGGPWDLLVVTRPAETTDAASVLGAIVLAGVKPAGVVLHHEMYVSTYAHLRDVHGPTYTDLNADFLTYQSIHDHIPE